MSLKLYGQNLYALSRMYKYPHAHAPREVSPRHAHAGVPSEPPQTSRYEGLKAEELGCDHDTSTRNVAHP